MLDTIGKRLKCCRAATGTTTHEVVDYIHSQGEELSYPTYTRWEAGSAFPGKKTAHLIGIVSDFFKKNGLQVEANWILSGEGFPPQFAEYTTMDEDTLFILASRTMHDVELIQVGGKYGEPYVNFGEFVIVSNESDIYKNNGKLCYVKTTEGVKIGIVSILDEKSILLVGIGEKEIKKSVVQECRKVKWIKKV